MLSFTNTEAYVISIGAVAVALALSLMIKRRSRRDR